MRKFLIFLLILIFLFFIYCFFFRKGGCCIGTANSHDTTIEHWVSWNLLFTKGSFNTTSTSVIQDFETYLTKYVKSSNPDARLKFQLLYCPCDSLLTNLDATLVYGSGNSVPLPPTNPNPGPKGDYTLGNNLNMYIPSYLDSNEYNTLHIKPDSSVYFKVAMKSGTGSTDLRSRSKLLAVIDTGLDSALFNLSFPRTVWGGNLLWQEDAGKPTLFDVVIGEATGSLIDGRLASTNQLRHGTAVTEIAITQIFQRRRDRLPQIMSIRAFDDSEKGSIYTVSCALSYAIQHKADFVNASWGYFGQEDSVLKSYIKKASDSSVRVIAAAGNTPGKHDGLKVCSVSPIPNPANNLDKLQKQDTILFYPACFAPEYKNIVSVSQFSKRNPPLPPSPPPPPTTTTLPLDLIPCFYQNYSSNYITLGAYELMSTSGSKCCTFTIPFLINAIEGSSFATPAMTAKFMAELNDGVEIKPWIRSTAPHTVDPNFTDGGFYFTFKQKQ